MEDDTDDSPAATFPLEEWKSMRAEVKKMRDWMRHAKPELERLRRKVAALEDAAEREASYQREQRDRGG